MDTYREQYNGRCQGGPPARQGGTPDSPAYPPRPRTPPSRSARRPDDRPDDRSPRGPPRRPTITLATRPPHPTITLATRGGVCHSMGGLSSNHPRLGDPQLGRGTCPCPPIRPAAAGTLTLRPSEDDPGPPRETHLIPEDGGEGRRTDSWGEMSVTVGFGAFQSPVCLARAPAGPANPSWHAFPRDGDRERSSERDGPNPFSLHEMGCGWNGGTRKVRWIVVGGSARGRVGLDRPVLLLGVSVGRFLRSSVPAGAQPLAAQRVATGTLGEKRPFRGTVGVCVDLLTSFRYHLCAGSLPPEKGQGQTAGPTERSVAQSVATARPSTGAKGDGCHAVTGAGGAPCRVRFPVVAFWGGPARGFAQCTSMRGGEQ